MSCHRSLEMWHEGEIEGINYATSWTREGLYLITRGRLEWLMAKVLKVSYQEAIRSYLRRVGPSGGFPAALGSTGELSFPEAVLRGESFSGWFVNEEASARQRRRVLSHRSLPRLGESLHYL